MSLSIKAEIRKCARIRTLSVYATILPSWQSIIGERYTFPSQALISVMSVSHFSFGASAVKSRLTRLPGAGVVSPS